VITAEQLTQPVAEHGEGPVWWPDDHLRCVDMLAGDLLDVTDGGEVTRTHVSDVAAVVRPRASGGAVVAVERGLLLLAEDGEVTALPELWSDPTVRMNEGGCDPAGRFYCGSMAYDAAPGRGRFYRFDSEGTPDVVFDSVTISNGFAFGPDGSTAYYVDTPTQRIDVLDYDAEAGLSNRRPFVEIRSEDGAPDGITVDRDGGVWVACWGAGAVRRFASDGSLDAIVRIPGVANVSACTLGGPALDRLYITTSRHGLDPAESGAAGAIFVVDAVVPGLPVQPAQM
jgi:sugar lactone lactonase YvrE